MSTSTISSITSPTSTLTPSPSPFPPLLPLLFPHFLSFLRYIFSVLLILPRNTIKLITYLSHSTIIPPLTYILAPLISFLSILYSITLETPYTFIIWLLEALFPLYVFCGVACITGSLIGLGGRIFCLSMVKSVSEEARKEGKGFYEETMKSPELDPDERSAKRRRVERQSRLGVKFEIDDDDEYW
ncbi:hypothetical protein NP233_g1477 [Leucocoprinus birnbaumii]|uniref:Uncharacterized protein n=1 Tax=Leucocoprinus birnbaumii TaxID=56174 RepID=A0AAD5W085_9AGAR|nr:hypothetical protein NP233_g1477 [Leucocoprinus birnbaumii]